MDLLCLESHQICHFILTLVCFTGWRSVTIFLNSIKMAPKICINLSKNLDVNLWSPLLDLPGQKVFQRRAGESPCTQKGKGRPLHSATASKNSLVSEELPAHFRQISQHLSHPFFCSSWRQHS